MEIFKRTRNDKNDIADLKKTEILEFKNTEVNMRNSMNRFKNRIYTAEEKIHKLKEQNNLSRKNHRDKELETTEEKDRCSIT